MFLFKNLKSILGRCTFNTFSYLFELFSKFSKWQVFKLFISLFISYNTITNCMLIIYELNNFDHVLQTMFSDRNRSHDNHADSLAYYHLDYQRSCVRFKKWVIQSNIVFKFKQKFLPQKLKENQKKKKKIPLTSFPIKMVSTI